MAENLPILFGLDDILDSTTGTPEDYSDYQQHCERVQEAIRKAVRDEDPVAEEHGYPYRGFMKYVIKTDRVAWHITARRRRNGTYEIKGLIKQLLRPES